MIVITKVSLFPEIVELVKRTHTYEVPEIISLPIIAGSRDYLKLLDIAYQWGYTSWQVSKTAAPVAKGRQDKDG